MTSPFLQQTGALSMHHPHRAAIQSHGSLAAYIDTMQRLGLFNFNYNKGGGTPSPLSFFPMSSVASSLASSSPIDTKKGASYSYAKP
ncbi:hypothetical protein EB796_015554 [Bugula neritina]|uniref:Uncharacterized protein n=1 Tax=Bugula neritina TaxID=10212 RepID=A0A7J7JKM8_BUGNE|nr:hypothetical protein EB796_015554 [Bugula neritina]